MEMLTFKISSIMNFVRPYGFVIPTPSDNNGGMNVVCTYKHNNSGILPVGVSSVIGTFADPYTYAHLYGRSVCEGMTRKC